MNKLQRIALGLALAATLATGASTASAKTGGQGPRRTLSGTVQRVDLRTRTLEVREDGTGRVIRVRVPDGSLLRTNMVNQPIVSIERLLPGMTIRDAIVQ
jgi:hypothetical protein